MEESTTSEPPWLQEKEKVAKKEKGELELGFQARVLGCRRDNVRKKLTKKKRKI